MACIGGACLPAPVVLAQAPACGVARLALAGDRVYWTETATGAVRSVAVASPGTSAPVATNQMAPGPITTDDVAVYWSNAGDGTIMHAPLAGAVDGGAADAGATDGGATDGGAQPLLTAPAPAKGLLASGGALYFTSGPSTLVVPRTGGTPTTLATFAQPCRNSFPVALALDPTYVYQTDTLSQYVSRVRIDGTQMVVNPCADAGAAMIAAPQTVTHSQGELFLEAIYVAGSEVVWADRASVNANVVAPAIVPSSRNVAGSAGSNPITGFVVSGSSVYFGEGVGDPGSTPMPTDDTIQIAPFGGPDAGSDGTSGQVIAVGQHAASSFAADATHVYWSTHVPSTTPGAADDCKIVSLAK
jgi:hypothetical protein